MTLWFIAMLGCGPTDGFVDEEQAVIDGLVDESVLDGMTHKPKDKGGTNGDYNYCDNPKSLCDAGEGDCDSDAQCSGTNVCGINNGSAWGFPFRWDVCVEGHCTNGVQDGDETGVDVGGSCSDQTCGGTNGDKNGYCTVACPCVDGEGDCDSDDQCAGPRICGTNNGSSYGMPFTWDVCFTPTYTHSDDIQPIWEANCNGCHIGGTSGGLEISSGSGIDGYDNIVNVASDDVPGMDLIEPGDPTNSYLFHKLEGTHLTVGGAGVQMPVGGPPYLDKATLAIIHTWIDEGAPR